MSNLLMINLAITFARSWEIFLIFCCLRELMTLVLTSTFVLCLCEFMESAFLSAELFCRHSENFNFITIGAVIFIMFLLWLIVVFLVGKLLDSLFAVLFDYTYDGLVWLQWICLIIYGIFFTLSLISKVHADLVYFDAFGKLNGYLPVAHCIHQDYYKTFFNLLKQLVELESDMRFNVDRGLPANAHSHVLGTILENAIYSLDPNLQVHSVAETDLRAIITGHLNFLAQEHFSAVASINYLTTSDGVPLRGVALINQQRCFFEHLCLKSYVEFFFSSPKLFPGISPSTNFISATFFYHYDHDFLELVNDSLVYRHNRVLNQLDSDTYLKPLACCVRTTIRKATSDIASILNPTHTIHTATAGDLLIGRLPRTVALEFIRYGSHHHEWKQTLPAVNLLDYASRGNALNVYTPNLVYLHPGAESGSIVVSRPVNSPSIVMGHPEYNQHLTACWDKLAEIPDTSSYFTKLQHWWFS
jgi:hypothetical protein